jgi:hypothetical protein
MASGLYAARLRPLMRRGAGAPSPMPTVPDAGPLPGDGGAPPPALEMA